MLDSYYELREIRPLETEHTAQRTVNITVASPALLLVTGGEGELLRGEAVYRLQQGKLYLLAAGARAEVCAANSSVILGYILVFDCYGKVEKGRDHLLYRRCHEGLLTDKKLANECSPRLLQLFELLYKRYSEPDSVSSPLTGHRLLLEIIELSLFGRGEDVKLEQEPIMTAIRHIQERYADQLNRRLLADLTGYHPHYFSRKFQQATGLSVTDYITEVRMRKAKEKLLTTTSSVRDIAAQVGYEDALYFSRKFFQTAGTYPTEYRRTPKRIAAYHFLGTLLQLGMQPIAVESHVLRYSEQLRSELGGIEAFEPWDVERIRQLEPELIVASNYMRQELRRQLEHIAPVLIQSEEASPLQNLQAFGSLLGKEREAVQAMEQLQQLAAELRVRLSEWAGINETTAVYELSAGRLYVMGRYDRCSYATYQMLGLRPPELIRHRLEEEEGYYLRLEPEQMEAYAADHMIVCMYEEEGMELTEQLLLSESWNRIPAVRNRQVYQVPIGKFWYNDGISLARQMYMLVELLESEGDDNP